MRKQSDLVISGSANDDCLAWVLNVVKDAGQTRGAGQIYPTSLVGQ